MKLNQLLDNKPAVVVPVRHNNKINTIEALNEFDALEFRIW